MYIWQTSLTEHILIVGMDVRHLFRLSVLFVSGQMLYRAVTQQCGSEASIFGWKLRRHIYHTMMAELGDVCVLACQEDDRCQSFNFVISVGMCEFSDRTKEARPEDFIPDPDRYYFRRAMNRGNRLLTGLLFWSPGTGGDGFRSPALTPRVFKNIYQRNLESQKSF